MRTSDWFLAIGLLCLISAAMFGITWWISDLVSGVKAEIEPMLIVENGETYEIHGDELPPMLKDNGLVYYCSVHKCYHVSSKGEDQGVIGLLRQELGIDKDDWFP